MLIIMFDPRFKDLFIVNNYVGKNITIITTTKYDYGTMIPFLCSTYQKLNVFLKPITNYYVAQEQPGSVVQTLMLEETGSANADARRNVQRKC